MKQRLLTLWKSLPPRRRKLAGWAVGVLIFYTVFGFLILPWIVKAVAVKQISKQLGRETLIQKVRINPFVLSGTIRGLLIKDLDGQPFISLEEGYANFQLASLFGKAWVFKDIWAIKPYCRVQINKDDSLNFSDLGKKFLQESSAPKEPPKPFFLHIDRLQIKGANASFTDLTPRFPFRRLIGPLEITLTNLQTDPNNQNPYSFFGTTDAGEKFSWMGQFCLEPLQSSGELALADFSIPKYAALFQDLVRFEIKDGVVNGRADYRFALLGSNYLATVTNAACSLKSLKVAEPGGSEDVLELDELSVSGVSADSAARSAEVGDIAISGGRIVARRNSDQTINLFQLAEPGPAETNEPGGIIMLMRAATNALDALVRSTNLWSATIHQIGATNCSVLWQDQATAQPVNLLVDQIALSASHISNIAGSNLTAALAVRWNTNGTANIGATVQISPPSADVSLNVTNIELRPLDPYLEHFVILSLFDGRVRLNGLLQMRTASDGLPAVTFHSDASMDDFAATDAQSDELLKWNSVRVTGLDATLTPPAVAIKEVAIVEPSALVALDASQKLNFLNVLKTPATNAQSATAESASDQPKQSLGRKLGSLLHLALDRATNGAGGTAMPQVKVDAIVFTNGVVQFKDHSVQPAVSMSIEQLAGSIQGVSSDALNRADIHLTCKAERTGPIEISGKVNPLDRNAPSELKVTVQDLNLSPTSPYAGKYLGYRLNRGRLGLQVDSQISQRQLKAKNVLVLDELTLGEKVQSPDATTLPVKLAIALLKDRNGRIELEVPIEGNIDEPDFRYSKVVLHVLGNLITKMVTSPFALLGAVFGGKDQDISFLDFTAGATRPDNANAQKLNTLIAGLYDRPGLELEIEGSFDQTDEQALRKEKLDSRFRQAKWSAMPKAEKARLSSDEVTLSPQEYLAFLEMAYARAVRSGVTNADQVPRAGPAEPAPAPQLVAGSGEKGAVRLLHKPVVQSTSSIIEKEQFVLSTISISKDALFHLAADRSRNVRQLILDSGKVDASRLSLAEIAAEPATNRASRVYFHLQ